VVYTFTDARPTARWTRRAREGQPLRQMAESLRAGVGLPPTALRLPLLAVGGSSLASRGGAARLRRTRCSCTPRTALRARGWREAVASGGRSCRVPHADARGGWRWVQGPSSPSATRRGGLQVYGAPRRRRPQWPSSGSRRCSPTCPWHTSAWRGPHRRAVSARPRACWASSAAGVGKAAGGGGPGAARRRACAEAEQMLRDGAPVQIETGAHGAAGARCGQCADPTLSASRILGTLRARRRGASRGPGARGRDRGAGRNRSGERWRKRDTRGDATSGAGRGADGGARGPAPRQEGADAERSLHELECTGRA
jgi:hypothetical protein